MEPKRRRHKRIFRWTNKRLRTENRLLRQRIDYLEQESSALADRLIRGQVNLAQEAENCISISHELHQLRDINSDAHRRLEDAYETIRELSSRRKDGDAEINHTGIQVDDTTMIEHIHSLQEELIDTHTREADLENTVRELKLRVTELELANKRLKESPPDDGIASLQEELISVKMREAEASLSLKEMRQKLAELEQQWAKYIHARTFDGQNAAAQHLQHPTSFESMPEISAANGQNPSPPASAPQTARGRLAKFTATLIGAASVDNGDGTGSEGTLSARELEDQLMGVRIREADAVAELKEMRQKVMELETQNHVCTNQLKRQDDEVKKLREQFEQGQASEKVLSEQLKEEKRKLLEMQSEQKEKSMMQRLKYSEAMQTVAELRQQISQVELKKAEKLTHDLLHKDNLSELDDDSISGGHQRSHSNGDAASLASEDMSALIADVTVRIPSDLLFDEGLMGDDDEEEDDDSSSKKERRLRSAGARQKDDKKASVASNIIKQGIIAEDGNETADSGLQLSDN
ncbi:hypothetical protein QR680_016201 [Steinernema hermaphroditum]|uniref:Uncharacterized protein n=1 Tax=Steinernema hermaphroditum TaxID=289476 RepID=A0AA39HCK5_9BILA|nr:hypothetical protein QR680_016201 [Steinernema hermaphroditum]